MEIQEVQNLYELIKKQQDDTTKLKEKITNLSLELFELKCILKDKGVIR